MSTVRIHRRSAAHRERGVATILVLLLLGLVVGTTVFTMTGSLRGTQQRQLTVHAATAAQGAAWRGVETIRTALLELPEDRYERWANGEGWNRRDALPATPAAAAAAAASTEPYACQGTPVRGEIAITGADAIAVPRATISEVCRLSGASTYRVTAQVTGRASEGTSATTSTVEAVYVVALPGAAAPPGGGAATLGAINIYRDLDISGGIAFTGENAVINVDGNVRLDNASITGIDTLRATGNVTIGSGIRVNTVESDGDVVLRGSSGVSQVRAKGNVRVEGGARPMSIRSDGSVTFAGGNGDVVEAKGDVLVTAGGVNISAISTEGSVRWTGSGGGAGSIRANVDIDYGGANRNPTTLVAGRNISIVAGATSAHAGGRVQLSGWGHTGQVRAGGDVVLLGSASAGSITSRGNVRLEGSGAADAVFASGSLYVSGWQGVGTGTIGGTLQRGQTGNNGIRVTVQRGYQAGVQTPAAVAVPLLAAIDIPRVRVDAYPLREAANYRFEIINGRIQVTVAHVQGIPAGTYVLGERMANNTRQPDWLCRPQDMSGTLCTRPVATICQGFSPQNSCFAHANGKWTVNGGSMARGIAWFDGNLEVANGTYVNTFIATGNISTAGAHRTMAPNWAGYASTCTNASVTGGANANFAQLIPTNLCDTASRTLLESTLANAAYIAGGYRPNGSYGGGLIDLGASTVASGNVVAGDNLATGGSTRIDGSIIVAAQSGATGQARISGSTTINQTTGDIAFDPDALPCIGSSCGGAGTAPPTGSPEATVLWTRYR
ncbi:DUF342 domain-containing protein [Luteimonas yindakuii]|uniref:DUF342 domain-containing protein n=1 Tax=Luteimonas yindakuii TaxID=2565782 RepID=UPI0010A402C4|nr:DUF342 domain-containing protein [Luteimonas yindakuii]QCO68367.1 DUF342 domain-containing protein [Luteimonas yindakuii]